MAENALNTVFAPGCALSIYKPELAGKMLEFLRSEYGSIEEHLTCCRHEPRRPNPTRVINICPGCDKRYRELYEGISTISLWEILSESNGFPFPDYGGVRMSILDACPTRDQARVHSAIRALLEKMNITLVEPEATRTKSSCCGDSAFGSIPDERVKELMTRRAHQMPAEDVVVYCVSCAKAMYIGGKKPRYLVDLLFGEETIPKTFDPSDWHRELDEYIRNTGTGYMIP
jgi:Fe-S oxidoreductase